jgi:D-serine deaminase-like pyridoxal phosphate-dependent protein
MDRVNEESLPGWACKGLPPGSEVSAASLGTLGWNVLAGDTGTPVAILRAGALAANLAVMSEFCRRHAVSLAPHAKTTMSPELTALQRDAGAWALTAATAQQVAALARFGAERILLANELTDPGALRWLAGLLAAPRAPQLIWYVDSLAGVELADEILPAAPPGTRPQVLVEVGHPHGRTGARSSGQALAVARAASRSDRLDLLGVAGFEGTIGSVRDDTSVAAVTQFLQLMRDTFTAVHGQGLLAPGREPVVSAGGSIYFDLVAATFAPLRDLGARIVLRSGCYLAHDHGSYAASSPDRGPGWDLPGFQPAIEVWGRVLSRPEPGLALVNFGRRDVSHDAGLPVPLWFCRRGSLRPEPADGLVITGLSDQHAFVRLPGDHPLAVADLLGAGISHPCTTFDRWRLLLLTDDSYRVTGGARTFF